MAEPQAGMHRAVFATSFEKRGRGPAQEIQGLLQVDTAEERLAVAEARPRLRPASPRQARGWVLPPHINVGDVQASVLGRQDRGSGARVRVEARPPEGAGQESVTRAPLHLGVLQHRPERRHV